MTDPVRNYVEARRQLEQTQAELRETVKLIDAVAGELKAYPARFKFANTEIEIPSEVAVLRGPSFDGGTWPSAADIQLRLVRWHEARKGVFDAWSRIPQEDRVALHPPGR